MTIFFAVLVLNAVVGVMYKALYLERE